MKSRWKAKRVSMSTAPSGSRRSCKRAYIGNSGSVDGISPRIEIRGYEFGLSKNWRSILAYHERARPMILSVIMWIWIPIVYASVRVVDLEAQSRLLPLCASFFPHFIFPFEQRFEGHEYECPSFPDDLRFRIISLPLVAHPKVGRIPKVLACLPGTMTVVGPSIEMS